MIRVGDEVTEKAILRSLARPDTNVYIYLGDEDDTGADVAFAVHDMFAALDVYIVTDPTIVEGWFEGDPWGVVFTRADAVWDYLDKPQSWKVSDVGGSIAEAKLHG